MWATAGALLLAACGGHASTAARGGEGRLDVMLAHRILAVQVDLMRDVKGGELGTRKGHFLKCTRHLGAAARVISPVLTYYHRSIELAVEDAVFPNDLAAQRGAEQLGDKRCESSRGRVVAQESRGHQVGPIRLSVPKVVNAGTTACAYEISAPYTYRGQHGVTYFDWVVASQGRLVTAISTTATVSLLRYDVVVDRRMLRLDIFDENHPDRVAKELPKLRLQGG
jgi:hypothetical protein